MGDHLICPDARREFSVVIPTYNRSALIGRAIDSVLCQSAFAGEIVVVDDASSDATEEFVRRRYPQVRYLRQEENQGPGAARQRGIQEASCHWVVMLDDDDCFVSGALETVAQQLATLVDRARYPVVQFAHGNGSLAETSRVVSLDDYLTGQIRGDFVPILQRRRFLADGLAYPATRLGGEHLLWWHVARTVGIPTWNQPITIVGSDSPHRLTSFQQQVRHAEEHARLQEMTLAAFGELLETRCPKMARKKHLGAAVYWMLAGKPENAAEHLLYLGRHGWSGRALGLRLLEHLPSACLRSAFLAFRWLTRQLSYSAATWPRARGDSPCE